MGFGFGDGVNSEVSAIAQQSDGKILIGGMFILYNSITQNQIARLNTDGTLDTTFHTGTGLDGRLNVFLFQKDGKIIIAGAFSSYNGIQRNGIARLNTDGTLDTSFDPGAGTNDYISTAALQNDGKIIIGGAFTSYKGAVANRIARILSNGNIDSTFHTGSGAVAAVQTMAIQNDGKIIIGGYFDSVNGLGASHITRLNMNGTIDSTFHPGSAANDSIESVSLQNDGKIIIGGHFTIYNGSPSNHIARLHTDGTPDTTFHSGSAADNFLMHTSIQNDGKIIISGNFTMYNGVSRNSIARLNADGSLDGSFNPGTGCNNAAYLTFTQIDGKILIGGRFDTYDGNPKKCFVRTLSNGKIDPVFNPGTGANDGILATAVQSDGKIIIGGYFRSFNGTTANHLARLHSDGTLDTSFKSGADDAVSEIIIQPDGKIIIAGDFTHYNNMARPYIARLHADGTLDTTFKKQTSNINGIYGITLQADGKILVGGNWDPAGKHLTRLNSDGSLDPAFHTGTGPDKVVNTISVQTDGKILIGGYFTAYNGTAINYMARLNADGTLDTTFNTGTGTNNYVQTIALQKDGRIIIGGAFHSYDGIARTGIARLKTDGNLDLSFNPDIITSVYVTIRAIAIQSDGKIIAGGGFTFENMTAEQNNITCLNTDGTVDTTFKTGPGTNFYVHTTTLQNDGKIIIAGDFTSYNSSGRNRIARLWSSTITGTDENKIKGSLLTTYPNPASSELTVLFHKPIQHAHMKLIHINGQVIQEKTDLNGDHFSFDISRLANGFYILEVDENGTISRSKLVKE